MTHHGAENYRAHANNVPSQSWACSLKLAWLPWSGRSTETRRNTWKDGDEGFLSGAKKEIVNERNDIQEPIRMGGSRTNF